LYSTTSNERPRDRFGESIDKLEVDIIVGKDRKGVIVTLVDKYSSLLLMRKLETEKKAAPLAQTVIKMTKEANIPVRSITTDNGTGYAGHQEIRQIQDKINRISRIKIEFRTPNEVFSEYFL